MTESTSANTGPGVALLFEDANLSAHLREALIEAGARIVHEGPATQATREDLSGNGADVVVVNLDAKVEEHLDALYDIFEENQQKVVFNDAEVSSGLSGWEQARWARHLAAKLLDVRDVDPPRPSEALAVEAHPTELMLPEDEMPEAPPEEAAPAEAASADDDGDAESQTDLTAELEALLAEDSDLLGRAEDDQSTGERGELQLDMGEAELSGDDLDAIGAIPDGETGQASDADQPAETESADAAAETPGEAVPAAETDAADAEQGDGASEEDSGPPPSPAADGEEDSAFEETLRMFDQALAENERLMQEDAQAAGGGDGDPHAEAEKLFQADAPAASEEVEASAPAANDDDAAGPEAAPEAEAAPAGESSTLELADPDSPAPAAEPGKPASSIAEDAGSAFSLVDPDEDSPADPAAGEKQSKPEPDAPDWGLVDYEDGDETPKSPSGMHIMQQNRKVNRVDPSEFGIEKVSASEYLAPEDETGDGEVPIEPGMSLELEPIEQAVAPKMIEEGQQGEQAGSTAVAHEEGQVTRAVVVAAGSSEESRASLRDFVAAIDRVPDAVLIGVVHQKAGDDLAALASQLDQASPSLSVRVAEAQGKARHGEMVLVPAGKQAALQGNGQLQMLDSSAQPMANPSIDLSMTLVAQEFGANTLGVVLAGDAIDALAGAQAVSDGGGKLWTLDPADCNDNTMVSVIGEEQLAQRTGSPQELAAQMLKELS